MNGNLRLLPLGYNQITALSAAVGLGQGLTNNAVPAGANYAVIIPETQAVRFRDDGTNPTAGVGVPIAVGQEFDYTGNLGAVKVIEQTASAKLNIAFYKIAG